MRPCSPRRPPSGTGGLWPVSHLQESLSGSCQHSVPRRACALSLAGDPQVPDACPDPDPCLLHICSSDHPHRSEPSGIPNVEGVRQAHLLVCGGGGGGATPPTQLPGEGGNLELSLMGHRLLRNWMVQ